MEEPTRRRFYIGAIYAVWGAIGAILGLPAFVYLLFPPKLKKESDWTEAGDIAGLTPDAPVEMAFRHNRVDGWKVVSEKSTAWVVRSENRVIAFGPQCTHLGCAYHWDGAARQFVCPCHSSLFSIDGKVVAGPAPRPLDRYDVRIEGTRLLLGRLRRPGEGDAA
jgi:menaquinol-cytochrome c reductase iron-sulfur subunit